ncbi:MFS transporter [Streptomyces sp. NPDC059224]|uniref:MFS transporter n=1 Tax=Streptomyces sp. NPDC059224 TaxID=3346775 RepID=UPI00369A7AE6
MSAVPAVSPAVVGYRDVLRMPYAARLLVCTLVGRLPSGMAPLAILLIGAGSGYGPAALLTAAYLLATAAGGPVLGRSVDRLGQTRVLTLSAVAAAAGLVLVLVDGGQLAGAVLAGCARPPLDATLRALWRPLLPDREHERVALSLDASSQEVIYIAGPLLVSTLAWTTSARGALMATAALGLAGTLLVATAPPSRQWIPTPRGTVGFLGPLRVARLRRLYAAMVCAGVPMGAVVPIAVHTADRLHVPGLSGVLPAAVSVGAMAGGLLYGARSWPGSVSSQLVALCAAWSVGWLPLLAADGTVAAVVACLVPGLAMAPLLSVAYVITSRCAPEGTATESGALLVAALDIGCAVGTAAAGGPGGPLLLPVSGTAAFLLLTVGPALGRLRLLPAASARRRAA